LEASLRHSPKLRLLRVFRLLAAVVTYCARNAGRLVALVWFPCILAVACQVVLDWLAVSYPVRLPDWLLSGNFNPPTWLTAVAITPWGAMVWAFVLSNMAGRNANRGLVTARLLRRGRLRFELSRDVLLAAAIFSAVNLLDGVTRTIQWNLLVTGYAAFEWSDATTDILGRSAEAIRILVMAAVTVWSYPVAGHVLRTGAFDVAHIWKIMRGNWLRLFAVFLLLSLAAIALDQLAAPATTWLIRSSADPLSWTVRDAFVRYLADLPFFMLWTVVYAVTVGIVLDVLDWHQPVGRDSRASRPA
jgi:hypothetical protein